MTGIYHVQWNQSGRFALSAVVAAEIAEDAIKAVGYMHNPTDVRADRIGTLDPCSGFKPLDVIAQEGL